MHNSYDSKNKINIIKYFSIIEDLNEKKGYAFLLERILEEDNNVK